MDEAGAAELIVAAFCDGGSLDCNGGLLIAIRRALKSIGVGEILEIRSEAPSVATDLPAWCEVAGHLVLEATQRDDARHYFVRRGR